MSRSLASQVVDIESNFMPSEKADTPKELYLALQKDHSKELNEQMKLFHLTPEMMSDPKFTIGKFGTYS